MTHRRLILSRSMSALAAVAALAGWPALSQASLVRTSAPLAAAVPQEKAWWTTLHEPALDTLIESAQRRALIGLAYGYGDDAVPAPLPARITGLYLGARVTSVRLLMARELGASLARQKQLVVAEGPRQAAAEGLAQLDTRLAAAQSLVQHLAVQQAQLVQALAQLCMLPPDALAQALRPALSNPVAPLAVANLEGDAVAPALQAGARSTALLSETVAARRLELAAVRKRVTLGEASEYELLDSFQRLLADGDRLVTAQGALTMQWIEQQAASTVAVRRGGLDDL